MSDNKDPKRGEKAPEIKIPGFNGPEIEAPGVEENRRINVPGKNELPPVQGPTIDEPPRPGSPEIEPRTVDEETGG